MSTKAKFWIDASQHITNDTTGEHPENWTKSEIDPFLRYLHQKLQQRCTEAPYLIEACGWQKPKQGELPDGSTISYDSFRRIFITRESEGNRTTRNMFAIYMGYQSYEDYLNQNNNKQSAGSKALPKEEAPANLNTDQSLSSLPAKRRPLIWKSLFITVLTLLFFFQAYKALNFSNPNGLPSNIPPIEKSPKLIFRNDNGIAVMSTEGGKPVQVISNRRYLTGIDYDAQSRLLFWSNSNSSKSYLGISCAQLDSTLSQIVPGSLRRQVISKVEYPAGIALDPNKKLLYCADYGDSTIKVFNYQGVLLEPNLIRGMKGAPSSLELDISNHKLYWTDVSHHRIGRFDTQTLVSEPNFIPNAGRYPDGLSVDTINNMLYWASPESMEIGVANLYTGNVQLLKVDVPPAAVEVNVVEQALYFSSLKSDAIRRGEITNDSILFDPSNSLLYTHGNLPSVLKLAH